MRLSRFFALLTSAALLTVANAVAAADPSPAEGAMPANNAKNASTEERKPPLFGISVGHRHSFLHPSVSRDAIAASAELRFARRASLALDAALFAPFDGSPNAAATITRTYGTAEMNMKGFILTGHEAPVELYVLGGLGVVRAKPVSVIDPASRRFDYSTRVAFSLGLGGRFHVSRALGVFVEGRVTPYIDQRENRLVSASPTGPGGRDDPNTWFGEKPLVTMVSLQAGLIFFLPFDS